MAELHTKGHIILFDDEDIDLVSRHTWCVVRQGDTKKYVVKNNDPRIRMHRLIMGTIGTKMLVDHKNHNGLDNRKENLRVCTKSQNCSNRRSVRGSSSKYLGVSKNTSRKTVYWQASISKMKKVIYHGTFKSEIEAAMAYNEWAKEVHGEFANLNVIEDNG